MSRSVIFVYLDLFKGNFLMDSTMVNQYEKPPFVWGIVLSFFSTAKQANLSQRGTGELFVDKGGI